MSVGRQMANRIGRGGVLRDEKRLAAATPKVNLPAITASAGLRHPVGAAECIERRRVHPDVTQARLKHVRKAETCDHPSRLAWQSCTVRGDGDYLAAPATQARLGVL